MSSKDTVSEDTFTERTHGRKCYVDSNESFPSATYYLNTNVKRPKYQNQYLNKYQYNKENIINNKIDAHEIKQNIKSASILDPLEINSESEEEKKAPEIQIEINEIQTISNNMPSNIPSKLWKLIKNKTINKIPSSIIKQKKFGAWDGVFVSCLLNIFGVIMFLRLGFVVGQVGLWYTFLIILISGMITILTTLSMAAIATNGEQRAGGAYYMISRTLGAALGGSVGILFSIGMSIAVSLYVIGFCETIVDQIGVVTDSSVNDVRMYGCILMTILLFCSVFGGISWIIRLQFILFATLMIAMLSFMIGAFQPSKSDDIVGIDGWTNGNLIENFSAHYTTIKYENDSSGIKDYNFFVCFGIFFPACTGIMAGANLSGDLKDPSHDIPLGTLSAVIVSTIVYMFMAILAAVSCSASILINDTLIMTNVSIWSPLVLLGIYAATLSSALTSMVGAPRILLSLSSDNLIPCLKFFAVVNKENEPIRAYIATYIIGIACVMIGHLNIVAPLITQFFLGTYAAISFACFSMSISHSPGWRPSFQYYNKVCCLLFVFLIVIICLL